MVAEQGSPPIASGLPDPEAGERAAGCWEEGLTAEHPGRYEITGELGAGAIGRVYLARDSHLGREVALKELHREPGGEGASRSAGPGTTRTPTELRFVNEARVTGQLEHPGIVPVYELGRRDDGTIYYAMRVVRGRTLREVLRSRELERRLSLLPNFVDLCHAVGYAHSRGVIHRDLKPANVMLGDFGETVVLDWGLAKTKGEQDFQSRALARALDRLKEMSAVETVVGEPIGTPAYMPPEQARGQLDEIDERSDVYSLGAVLYELLAGRPPFAGDTALEVMDAVIFEPPAPPQQIEPQCPPELAAIALRALSKDKALRYADAGSLAADVRRYLTGGLVRAHEYSLGALLWRWLRRVWLKLAVAAVLCAVAAGVWWYRGHELARRQAQAVAEQEAKSRRRAIAALEQILEQVARGGSEPRWFENATFKLIALRDPITREAVEDRLIAALADKQLVVRRIAARALGGLGALGAVEPLCARLEEGVENDEEALIEVINALGLIGDSRAEQPVAKIRWRHKQYSRLWDQTAGAYRLIPLPPVPETGLSAADWHERGRALENKGDSAGALEAYERAIELDPKLARSYNNRANNRKRLGDYKGAIADYNKAALLEPGDWRHVYNRALMNLALEDYDGALADADKAIAMHRHQQTLRNRALVHRRRWDHEQGFADLDAALALDPNDARTHAAIGYAHMELQQWDRALAALDRELSLNDKSATALVNRAYIHQVQGNLNAARADLDRALELDPDGDSARWQRANLLLSFGDRKAAKVDIDHCIESVCPNAERQLGERYRHRGILYHAQLSDYGQALADMKRAILEHQSPSDKIFHALMAAVLAQRAGDGAQRDDWLATLEPTGLSLFPDRLLRLLDGTMSLDELEADTPWPFYRCYVLLVAGLRAELDGNLGEARGRYYLSREVNLPNDLPCILSRISHEALAQPPPDHRGEDRPLPPPAP